MSTGEFAYNHFTLDELRSLAASPQVGTMQAMPQSFRALADRVGEVADLLTHAQADLPNWWKGPAADQAAATLGRAAAEAREFHDSAMGAATAVSRCAQVVAEQQHQMMNVPQMPEPGITDVVQRPATPLEALEAARQDARYQAAHEQAVQVVNGIAAEYVATRRQLSSIGIFQDDNFTPSTAPLLDIESNTEPASGEIPRHTEVDTKITKRPSEDQYKWPEVADASEAITSTQPTISVNSRRYTTGKQNPELTSSNADLATHRAANSIPDHLAADSALPHPSSSRSETTDDEDASDTNRGISNANHPANKKATPEEPSTEYPSLGHLLTSDPTSESLGELTISRPIQYDYHLSTNAASKDGGRSNAIQHHSKDTFRAEGEIPPAKEASLLSSSPQPSHQVEPSEELDNKDSAIIPPYTNVGHVRHTRDERNPRPSYLKERKSAWLPDAVAAPADGVLTPDWFKLH